MKNDTPQLQEAALKVLLGESQTPHECETSESANLNEKEFKYKYTWHGKLSLKTWKFQDKPYWRMYAPKIVFMGFFLKPLEEEMEKNPKAWGVAGKKNFDRFQKFFKRQANGYNFEPDEYNKIIQGFKDILSDIKRKNFKKYAKTQAFLEDMIPRLEKYGESTHKFGHDRPSDNTYYARVPHRDWLPEGAIKHVYSSNPHFIPTKYYKWRVK